MQHENNMKVKLRAINKFSFKFRQAYLFTLTASFTPHQQRHAVVTEMVWHLHAYCSAHLLGQHLKSINVSTVTEIAMPRFYIIAEYTMKCANRRKVDLECSIFRIHCQVHCFVIKLEDESFYLLCNDIKTVVKKMISGRINDITIFLTHIPGKECDKNYKVTPKKS